MLSNPFYCGIVVAAKLTEHRPEDYDCELFLKMANILARQEGSEQCVRLFLAALRDPYSNWASRIPIHPCFAEPREAIITQEQFIRAAVEQMREHHSVERYFRNVAENLSQGAISLPPTTKEITR